MNGKKTFAVTCAICGAMVLQDYGSTDQPLCRNHCVSLNQFHVPGNNNNNLHPAGLRYFPLSVDAGPPPRNNNNWYADRFGASNNAG